MGRDPDDEDFDFPPTEHPVRELLTMSFFAVVILAFLIWLGWSLISWL